MHFMDSSKFATVLINKQQKVWKDFFKKKINKFQENKNKKGK